MSGILGFASYGVFEWGLLLAEIGEGDVYKLPSE